MSGARAALVLALAALFCAPVAAQHDGHGGGGHHGGGTAPVNPTSPQVSGPPTYRGNGSPLLSDDQLEAILNEERGAMKSDPNHHDSWLPYDASSGRTIDGTFGDGTYRSTRWGAHKLLRTFKEQYSEAPRDQLKQGLSDIVHGVRGIVDTGLEYAGVKENPNLSRRQRDAKLAALDAKMERIGGQLENIPLRDGKVIHEEMMAVSPKYGDPGLLRIMNKVSGFDHMDNTIAQHPANPALQVAAGNEMLQQGDAAKAKEYFNNALSLDPSNLDALTGRAAANADLRDFAGAQSDARAALAIDPNDPAALALAAMAREGAAGNVKLDKDAPFKNSAEDDGALRAAPGVDKSSLRYLAPSNGAGLQSSAYTREAARALALGDAEAALHHAGRAIALDSKNPDAFGLRAFAHAKAGNYEAALKDAMAALALDPANTMAHNARAKALNKMGLYNEALHAADDALRANPRNAYAYYMRAMALQGLGNRKAMIAALGAAAALDPRYQDAYDLAKSAPAEQDMSFLFPEDQLLAAKAALAAQGGPRPRYWGMTMPVLAGLALAGLALLYWLTTLVPRAKQAYATVVRTGPALGTGTATLSLPVPPPIPTPRGTQTGTVLRGQYRRLGQIGSSVHGAVYEGVDLSLQRPIAIRKLRADMRASDRERFLGPARAAAALSHPGIAPVYAVLEEGEALYLVTEFAPGRSLRDTLAANGPLAWEQALPLFRQVAAALDYAHAHGVAHGAIKASNVMLSPEGRARLIDFGLARGPADPAADLLAFGACLREAIAGLPPARLDAVDAALRKARSGAVSAAEVLAVVEAGLASTA